MKFWLTVVVGVVVVAAASTTLMVLSPNTAPKAAPTTVVDPEKQPMAEIVGERETVHQNVAQHQKGQDVFKIRNASTKVPLVLTPMKPTCQCTDMFLSDREPSPSEPAPDLAHQRSDFTLKPGQIAFVVARWDTKEKLGKQEVSVPVRTDDPKKFEFAFRITLNIHQEFVQSAERLEFGMIDEGKTKEVSATITSMIRDKFAIEKIETSGNGIIVTNAPLTAQELKEVGAKAGYRIDVKNTGKNPVGALQEGISISLKTPETTQFVRFEVTGQVLGDVVTDPPGSIIDFKEITLGTYKPKKVTIFPRALGEKDVLRVGTVKPAEVLAATLERHPNPKIKGWNLTVSVKPNAPGGLIDSGSISVLDSSGKERLVFKVTGIVDPSFTHTAAR